MPEIDVVMDSSERKRARSAVLEAWARWGNVQSEEVREDFNRLGVASVVALAEVAVEAVGEQLGRRLPVDEVSRVDEARGLLEEEGFVVVRSVSLSDLMARCRAVIAERNLEAEARAKAAQGFHESLHSVRFAVKLIQTPSELTAAQVEGLVLNCDFLAGRCWIFEGDIEALEEDYGLEGLAVLAEGVTPGTGDMSRAELLAHAEEIFGMEVPR